MSDEETVYDENGNEVLPEDRDYLEQQAKMREQRDWEQRWFRPTADSDRLDMQETIRRLEDACVRAADAIELHVASPRAMARTRRALKMWPSGSMDNDRLMNKLNGPSLRRVARAHGYDYDLLRAMDDLWPPGNWPDPATLTEQDKARVLRRAKQLREEDDDDD